MSPGSAIDPFLAQLRRLCSAAGLAISISDTEEDLRAKLHQVDLYELTRQPAELLRAKLKTQEAMSNPLLHLPAPCMDQFAYPQHGQWSSSLPPIPPMPPTTAAPPPSHSSRSPRCQSMNTRIASRRVSSEDEAMLKADLTATFDHFQSAASAEIMRSFLAPPAPVPPVESPVSQPQRHNKERGVATLPAKPASDTPKATPTELLSQVIASAERLAIEYAGLVSSAGDRKPHSDVTQMGDRPIVRRTRWRVAIVPLSEAHG